MSRCSLYRRFTAGESRIASQIRPCKSNLPCWKDSTAFNDRHVCLHLVHPHTCGENGYRIGTGETPRGPSPRVWGIRFGAIRPHG